MRGGSRRRRAAGGVLLVALVTALAVGCSVGPASNRAAHMGLTDQNGEATPTPEHDGDSDGDGLIDSPPPDGDPTTPAVPETYEAASDSGTIEDVSTLAEGIGNACCITQLSNGDLLVGTQDGVIYRVGDDEGTVAEAGELHSVALGGDRMLLGLAAEPDATDDVTVYAYYSRGDESRIGTYVYDEDDSEGDQLTPSDESMIEDLPIGGGALAFDHDGNLTASAGTEILRVTSTGDVPGDNPDPTSAVYASGFSDVQGLAWDPSGRLWVIDAGDGTASSPPALSVVERDAQDGTVGPPMPVGDPLDLSGQPTGLAYGGDSHPFWVTTAAGQEIWRAPPDGRGGLAGEGATPLSDPGLTPEATDVVADGETLHLLSSDGRVLRLDVT
ncbi:PQQ-dependent sugar dehydrogenase [Streptomyces sp. 6N223]|uniref:PQQ-dependent sugar dehydrogenase n=1 Tax=Streptomyces sp. 6N223 TaxID=3457412 RepID=UPI003FD22D11